VAAYRDPLTLEQYLDSPMIVDPLCRYDCVPWVTGAEALLITSADRSGPDRVRVRAQVAKFNFDHQDGDGLSTGLGVVAPELWESAGLGPEDMDVLAIYDDYPAMVLIQLQDLGYIADGDVERFVRTVIAPRTIPINTSGGQLSAGQAGGAAGMHGLVEVVQQLRGRAEDRQVDGANIGLAVGYGSVIYRYAGCSGAAILERA
jgi:acetyl-CoA acetyltransferase